MAAGESEQRNIRHLLDNPKFRVIVHDAQDREQLDDLGTFEGVPLPFVVTAIWIAPSRTS